MPPEIAARPHGAPVRLLDLGVDQVSDAGLAERYGRGETAHTIHVWWARRPHAAMRALVFAALCTETSAEARALLGKLGQAATVPDAVLAEARALLEPQYGGPPAVLDMFHGGGTIALEALRLGAEAHAIDVNELAVFLGTCNLVYAHEAPHAIALLPAAGERVLARLAAYTDQAFPLRRAGQGARVTTYFWTYRMACPGCGYRFVLSRRPWLSRKRGIALRPVASSQGEREELELADTAAQRPHGVCPRCEHVLGPVDIRQCEDALVAVVHADEHGRSETRHETRMKGKRFALAPPDAVPAPDVLAAMEAALLGELGVSLPDSALPRWSGIVNPALYGMATHADVLNPRQRIVVLALVRALREEHALVAREAGAAVARCVVAFLSALIDQCVDWNCRLSMWIAQNEQVGRALCGPGVPMLWDYAETDPVLDGPSNLRGKLARIVQGARWIGALPRPGHVHRAPAQALPFGNDSFDAVVTDPPYYDNLYYSVLADFLYAWKRLLLADIVPELFAARATDAGSELVASAQRSGAHAHERYTAELGQAMREAARVMKDSAALALVYSHAAVDGWAALVSALASAPLIITSVQPLRVERRQRPRAMSGRAVHTCLVLVARKVIDKLAGPRSVTAAEQVYEQVQALCTGAFTGELLAAGWSEADVALAVFAQGAALWANGADTSSTAAVRAGLERIELVVQGRFPGFALSRRRTQ